MHAGTTSAGVDTAGGAFGEAQSGLFNLFFYFLRKSTVFVVLILSVAHWHKGVVVEVVRVFVG